VTGFRVAVCREGGRSGFLPGLALVWAACFATPPWTSASAHDTLAPHAAVVALPTFDYEPPAPGTYALANIATSPSGQVLDSDGRQHPLARYATGRIVLLSLIYTRCSDRLGCPLASAVLGEVAEALRRDARLAAHVAPHVRLVTMSFDPAHDSPAVMAAFRGRDAVASETGAAVEWAFLTTASAAALRPILEGYDQHLELEFNPAGASTGGYTHLLKVFLLDRQGQVRNVYGVAYLDPRLLLADIETLLIEETKPRP
jgi:cytochrome oxidase Cu insertion factor (SCO1/SenC/PrrC family)